MSVRSHVRFFAENDSPLRRLLAQNRAEARERHSGTPALPSQMLPAPVAPVAAASHFKA